MDSLSTWLGELGLERYATVLEANGVDLEALPLLTDRDLAELGVLLGHRRRLLDALSHPQRDTARQAPQPSRAQRPPGERRQLTVLFAISPARPNSRSVWTPKNCTKSCALFRRPAHAS